MIKLSTAFMKKVPVQGQEFSSQSFHASIELELSDALTPEQIGEKIHRTGEFLRNAVDKELESGAAADAGAGTTTFAGSQPQQGNERKASNKQVKFITDLAAERKIPISDLNADIRKRFNVGGLYDLSAKQASAVLDEMNAGGRRQRAA